MAIVKMKHLRLIALAEEQEALLDELLRVGCVEIATPEARPEDPEWEQLLSKRGSTALGQVRSESGALKSALEALKRYAPGKEGMLTPRPYVTEEQLFDPETTRIALESAGIINQAVTELNQAVSAENRLQTQQAGFLPWAELDLPLETESTDTTELVLGVLPAGVELEPIQQALAEAAPLCEMTEVSRDKEQCYVLLVCHKSDFQAALDTLKSRAFSQVRFKGVKGTAKENLAALDEPSAREELSKTQAIETIAGQKEHRDQIKLVIDRVYQDIQKEEGKERLLTTDKTFLLEGWYSAPEEEQLLQVLNRYTCAWELSEPVKEDYPKVPVKLKNSKLTKPLNMVTEMYSLPAYGSLDPNPLMFPFFVLFYGIMMADMAYGLIMMAISFIVCKKKHPRGNIFQLIGLCGVSTFIFGALTGGFLGDFIPQLLKLINPASTFEMPALFTPLDDTLMILLGAMCLGVIQIVTGMAINFYKLTKRGQFLDALMDVGSWWLVFIGIVVGVLTGFWWVAIAGVLALILTQGRSSPTIIGKLVGGVSSLYDITSYFGDVLSYARLMALMLAGSVIAQVFNTLGAIPGNVVFFIIISLAGNTLNFGLNILGCYVHDLRLQCLEYFGKFYEDGGKPFRPLAINTEYVDMVNK